LNTGLAAYFGTELGRSKAENGPAGSLAFAAEKPDPTTPTGAAAEVAMNRRIGEDWNEANRRQWNQPRQNAGGAETATPENRENRQPWNGSGEPQELGQVIDGGSRRKVADGILGDVPRNRSIGDEINRLNRERCGQSQLLHGK